MKAKAYSYLRFSTLDQIHGDSLRRQTEAAAAWCRHNGVNLVDSYRDLGVSAFKGKNAETGALASFLALVKKGTVPKGSYLIVESLDRISRNSILEAFELFVSIIRAGIIVVTLSDNHSYDVDKINGGNFTDLIISLTILSRAHEESRMKAMRVAAAWDAKRRNIETRTKNNNQSGSAAFIRELYNSGISKSAALEKAIKKYPIMATGIHFKARWETAERIAKHAREAAKTTGKAPARKVSTPPVAA
jgi:DNA invertase Pin-like site-specific DNA recombinase